MNSLTIGIVSYNRPQQLARCLNSLLPLPAGVEVLIRDDCSPKIQEIILSIQNILHENKNIALHVNDFNVGYDENLFQVIACAKSTHILLLGDDDLLEPGAIPNILSFLGRNELKVGFLRYRFSPELVKRLDLNCVDYYRNNNSSIYFGSSEAKRNGTYVYNAILFSGLLFSQREVLDISDELDEFKKSIYIQVAIFILLSYKHGGWFVKGPGVMIGSDGENGFGLNSASTGDSDLVDRSDVLSNLRFSRRLIIVIDKLSDKIGADFARNFFKEFNLRNLSGMREARKHGRSSLNDYWSEFCVVTRFRPFHYILYFYLIWILPSRVNQYLMAFPEKVLRRLRTYK